MSLPPNPVTPMPSMPSSVKICRVMYSRIIDAAGGAPTSGSSCGSRTTLLLTCLIFIVASFDVQLVQEPQIRIDAETRTLRQRQISVERLVPVAERIVRQIAIEPLDQRRARQRRGDVRGR